MLASIVKVNGYSPFKTLMLREYWENRRAIFTTPLVITGLAMALVIVGMGIFGQSIHIDDEAFTLREFISTMSERDAQEMRDHLNHALLAANMPVFIGVWFCMVFTALGSLYDERKDNSILFWKSMPVSDLQTVASKLLTVMLVIPLVAIGFTFIFQVFLLIVGSFATIGTEFSAWELLWGSSNLPALLLTEISAVIIYGLWSLPIFAWFMLASVVAKRTPLLVATIPVALAALMEELFFNTNHLLMFVANRLSINTEHNIHMDGQRMEQISFQTPLDMFQSISDPELWLGLALSAALLYLTIVLRKRKSL
ncbi:hypothetical protein [Paremcibacter congregatus]|uniref:hypothetical protein n=1 Tax=Paremcibacter congregatus TaxID=2043170 RepID=UPI003A925CBD